MKTLVVYGSKYGAAAKCAELIAKGIKGDVKVINLKEESDIKVEDYDKVVIGSSIYAGMIRKEVKIFCEKNKEMLEQKKVAIFISAMSDELMNDYLKNGFGEQLIDRTISTVCCGGILNFKEMNFLERFITKKIMAKDMKQKGKTIKPDGKKSIEEINQKAINQFINLVNKA